MLPGKPFHPLLIFSLLAESSEISSALIVLKYVPNNNGMYCRLTAAVLCYFLVS